MARFKQRGDGSKTSAHHQYRVNDMVMDRHDDSSGTRLNAPDVSASSEDDDGKSQVIDVNSAEIAILKAKVEFLQATIVNLESEKAYLRRYLESELEERRTMTSALLERDNPIYNNTVLPEYEHMVAPPDKIFSGQKKSSKFLVFIVTAIIVVIVQIALMFLTDGYYFAW
jgi:cell division protein FtsB